MNILLLLGGTDMENKISLRLAKNVKDGLIALFHEVPAARARKERAEATIKEVEAYDQFLKFLETVGYSPEERKLIIARILASKSSEDNPIKNLQVIAGLFESNRIGFQITNDADECTDDEDRSQDGS